MSVPDNPQAFPFQETSYGASGPEYGMTLRDWFAGQALNGAAGCVRSIIRLDRETQAQADARWSYERADAMLAAREQGK